MAVGALLCEPFFFVGRAGQSLQSEIDGLMDSVPAQEAASSTFPSEDINLESHFWRSVPVTGSVPIPRHAFVSALYKEKFYVIAGYGQGGSYLSDSWVVDLTTKSWSYFPTKLSLQIPIGWLVPPMHSACYTLYGSKLYVFGGITHKGQHLGSLITLDLETAQWSCPTPPTSPRARWGSSMVEFGGNLYCFGGFGDVFYSDLWKFDPIAGTWTELQPLGAPPPRHYHTAVVFNGQMYIMGGFRGSIFTSDIWAYEFATNRWLKIAGVNTLSNRRGHSCVLLPAKSSCLVFGGRDDKKRLNDIIEFSFETNTYKTLRSVGDFPESRIFHSAFIHGRSMYVFAGLNLYNTNELVEYVLESDPTLSKGSRIDYAPLWKSQVMSDVTFHVVAPPTSNSTTPSKSGAIPSDSSTEQEGVIHAHKIILYSASEHFRTLFNVGMRESTDGIIKIDDMSIETLEEVLHFIYTGKLNRLTTGNALDLLVAADKFMIPEMVQLIERALSFVLSGDNLANIMATAAQVPSAKATFRLCVSFLRSNPHQPAYAQCKKVLKQADEAAYHEIRTLRRQKPVVQKQSMPPEPPGPVQASPSTPPLTDSQK